MQEIFIINVMLKTAIYNFISGFFDEYFKRTAFIWNGKLL